MFPFLSYSKAIQLKHIPLLSHLPTFNLEHNINSHHPLLPLKLRLKVLQQIMYKCVCGAAWIRISWHSYWATH